MVNVNPLRYFTAENAFGGKNLGRGIPITITTFTSHTPFIIITT